MSWIGLTLPEGGNYKEDFKWTDGSTLNYKNWQKVNPSKGVRNDFYSTRSRNSVAISATTTALTAGERLNGITSTANGFGGEGGRDLAAQPVVRLQEKGA